MAEFSAGTYISLIAIALVLRSSITPATIVFFFLVVVKVFKCYGVLFPLTET